MNSLARIALVLLTVGLPATPGAAGTQLMKHSGSIIGFDESAAVIVMSEVGPWRVEDVRTVVTTRTISVTPDTLFVLVRRAERGSSGFTGGFIEERLDPWDIFRGDFVTVDCLHRGDRQIALKVVVYEIGDPDRPW